MLIILYNSYNSRFKSSSEHMLIKLVFMGDEVSLPFAFSPTPVRSESKLFTVNTSKDNHSQGPVIRGDYFGLISWESHFCPVGAGCFGPIS